MASRRIANLADCTQFRQTLLAQPPLFIHCTAMLLLAAVTAAVGWAAWTKADLVVRTHGRVRPVDEVAKVFTPMDSELDGQVAEVHFVEGAVVAKGQVLLRLDTRRLDNRIAEVETRIVAADRELQELESRDELLRLQREASLAKADVELAASEARLSCAQAERKSRVRQAEAACTAAEDTFARMQRLAVGDAVSQQEISKAHAEMLRAREQLELARLPVDNGHVDVLRCAREAVQRDFAVRQAELSQHKVIKQSDVEMARQERASFELARRNCVLRSPLDGVVVSGRVKPGHILQPGTPVVEIASRDDIYLEAAVPGGEVGELKVGMPVKIKLDAFDFQRYGTLAGEVSFISPDSQVQGIDDSPAWAYLVRIELHGKSVGRGALRGVVKLGMGATAEIVIDRQSLLEILVRRIRRSISLG